MSTTLGYDPTIQLVRQIDSKAIYHIEAPEHLPDGAHKFWLFETEDLLSDIGAEAFRGRGTRIWTVR